MTARIDKPLVICSCNKILKINITFLKKIFVGEFLQITSQIPHLVLILFNYPFNNSVLLPVM
ncbi:hypothetical protein YPPY72_1835 [Yersinia pestis PY-72]|nr:hypothetical protein YPPY72_1835 [Yersinia pestis PY-72]